MSIVHALLAGFFPPRRELLSEVEPGRVATVRGEVVPRDLIESTLTGDRCVYYQYTVEEWRQSHSAQMAMDGFWEVVERDEAIAEFYLSSAGERAIVSPTRVQVERGRQIPVAPVDLGGILNRRAQQLVIRAGDVVEVTALVEVTSDLFDEGRDYRAMADRLLLTAPRQRPLQIRVLEQRAASLRGG